MSFQVHILGSNAAIPAYGRHPTSQVVSHNNTPYLIDCGEGTQMRLNHFHIKKGKIEHIFISHLHGDHIFGLVGLITSYALLKRNRPLTIYAPSGIQDILDVHLKDYAEQYSFSLNVKIITEASLIYENKALSVHAFPLEHGIECYGFRFQEKPKEKNILKEKIVEYSLDYKQIIKVKSGEELIIGDKVIPNDELTLEPPPLKSYAYCTDTLPVDSTIDAVRGADLLYHEATFKNEDAERAAVTHHTTTVQAAELAQKAGVKKLIIGHFSAKYKELKPLLDEAQTVFPHTALALEGEIFEV